MLARIFEKDDGFRLVVCDDTTGERIKMTEQKATLKDAVKALQNSDFVPYDSLFNEEEVIMIDGSKPDEPAMPLRIKVNKIKDKHVYNYTFGFDDLDMYDSDIDADNLRCALEIISHILPINYSDYEDDYYIDLSLDGYSKLNDLVKKLCKNFDRPWLKTYFEMKEAVLDFKRNGVKDLPYSEFAILFDNSDFIKGLQYKGSDKWVRTRESLDDSGTYEYTAISFDFNETRNGFKSQYAALVAGEKFDGYDTAETSSMQVQLTL